MGIRKTLKVHGKQHLRAYHAHIRTFGEKGKTTRIGKADRWFCTACGTHLYLTDDRWPAGVWPHAAAIDTA
ncbi:MAG: GFA family protein, partial [Myxococcales bacterium]